MANKLRVFCVSSRAYQSLCGLVRTRTPCLGLETREATGIPQLISHAKTLTESQRTHTCVQFLNDLLQNMNSLRLWAVQDNDEICLTDEEKQAQVDSVKSALMALEKVRIHVSIYHMTFITVR